jgi:AraC family transcriptional regulator of adaptative response/methylated-DNA-[protein]-cysteine methyltransferase
MIQLSTEPVRASAALQSDDERWTAVLRRDHRADGTFYYSVKTTGVYCRPSCPSRRPWFRNVMFHSTREEAERAGCRPCKRCRPDTQGLAEHRLAAVARACRVIESAEEPPSLETLATAAGMSRFHFHRIFKAVTGVTPQAYAHAQRAKRMREALANARSITEAIYDAGFNSNGRFYAAAPAMLGMQPTKFRAGGKGEVIRFAIGECSLGSILVAATDKGVCAIMLGDNPDALVRDLQDRFRRAELVGGDEQFERLVSTVVAFVEKPATDLQLPLDVRGTAFQRRVWEALRQVPRGTVVSYSTLAQRIGAPKAVRAVAQACASNAIALAIPCHRVVCRDGALSGYRWGVERKRILLGREAS